MNDIKDAFGDHHESPEHRLERVSRNLSEAADELQRLVDVLWRDLRTKDDPQ